MTLAELEQRNKACTACPLRVASTQVVVSAGDGGAPLVIVGEGPGAEEDRQGLPFVGPSGQLLWRILEAAQIAPQDVYLTNVVKCRTPQNRAPDTGEILTCTGLWLTPQLDLLRPRVLLSLGNTATQHLLGTDEGISRLRGQWFRLTLGSGHRTLLMPLLHPAYLLRHAEHTVGGPKSLTWRDIREVAAVLYGHKEAASVRGVPEKMSGSLFDGM